jgi:putative SOS response-associated peptidase YedK
MCNNYEQLAGWPAFSEVIRSIGWSLPGGQGEADLPVMADVRISQIAPVLRQAGNGVELAPMRWGFAPMRPGQGPVFNFRSEGRDFTGSRRCLIPATAFFEFTGTRSPKTKHRFTLAGEPVMGIAGIWRPGGEGEAPAFTMLTIQAGPDLAPIHGRQVVPLPPARWPAWVHLERPQGEILTPLAAGGLSAEIVRRGRE